LQPAILILEKLIQQPFKKQAKTLNLLGECYLALGDKGQAYQYFREALEVNTKYLKAYKNLAEVAESQGNPQEARQYLEQAQSLSPLNGERLFHLGRLCLKIGEGEQARQYLKESLKFGQSFMTDNCAETAEILLQAGLDEAAEGLLTESIKSQPENVILYNKLGVALRRQGKHLEALKCYQRALQLTPKSEKVYYNIGILYFDLGEKEKAYESFRTALRLRPDFAEARDFLARHFPAPTTSQPINPDAEGMSP